MGYNHFNIPKLTFAEINDLIEANNRKIKNEERELKKIQRKK